MNTVPMITRKSELKQHLVDDSQDEKEDSPSMGNPETGLSTEEAESRLTRYGLNQLAEKEKNIYLVFLSYFWGAMPIMIWVACIVEIIIKNYADFAVLFFLLFINGIIGFTEEASAGNAIAALKNQLAPKCTVKRDGQFKILDAKYLVPGDVVNLKLGDIVPADCVLLEGSFPLEVDQSALTGESLPITSYPGEGVKMGAIIKRGELEAHVTATGSNTFFGKAATMVQSVESRGRFQIVLDKITVFLLALSVVVVLIILIVLLARGTSALLAIATSVVLLVASIPIAMQVVSASTMAVGARKLAEKGVIVAKLSAIEEMAGMNMLCSDKTGTLTQNKLKVYDPVLIADITADELSFYSALAAKRMEEGQDAIDFCITQHVKSISPELNQRLNDYVEMNFLPFDPVAKRTEATLRGKDGKVFKVTKGAPQVVLKLSNASHSDFIRVSEAVQSLADRGYRALGVARQPQGEEWEFLGVLSLFDPPRDDTAETIKRALAMGIEVKMVTGDQTAIAKETCRTLGMGTNILGTEILDQAKSTEIGDIVRHAHGFAEVFPEHKFQIVEILMNKGFTCGMTGDGVNDAPALKKAHIGIAVQGATDAARAAADIVLTDPGLSTIIDGLVRSRKIFARVRNYCIYRIAATLQVVFFFFIAVFAFRPQGSFPEQQRLVGGVSTIFGTGDDGEVAENTFSLPVIALVLITILNDGTIITICRDKVVAAEKPQSWNLPEMYVSSIFHGMFLVFENIVILLMAFAAAPGNNAGDHCGQRPSDFDDSPLTNTDKCTGFPYNCFGGDEYGTITYKQTKSVVYLSLSLSAFLTVYSARTIGPFYSRRPGGFLAIASTFAVVITILFSAYVEHISGSFDMQGLNARTIFFCLGVMLGAFLVQDLLVKPLGFYAHRQMYGVEDQGYVEAVRQNFISNAVEQENKRHRASNADAMRLRQTIVSPYAEESSTRPSMARPHTVSNADNLGSSSRIVNLEKKVDQLDRSVQSIMKQLDELKRLQMEGGMDS